MRLTKKRKEESLTNKIKERNNEERVTTVETIFP